MHLNTEIQPRSLWPLNWQDFFRSLDQHLERQCSGSVNILRILIHGSVILHCLFGSGKQMSCRSGRTIERFLGKYLFSIFMLYRFLKYLCSDNILHTVDVVQSHFILLFFFSVALQCTCSPSSAVTCQQSVFSAPEGSENRRRSSRPSKHSIYSLPYLEQQIHCQ